MMSLHGEASCPGCFPEMGTDPSVQARELLSALLLGVGLGLLYDLLRLPRRQGGERLGAVLDGLFAMLAGTAAFLHAMGAAGARMGIWRLAAALLGFLLYLDALSPAVLPLLEKCFRLISKIIRLFKKFEKNMWKSAKKIFPNLREWIIMKR